MQYTIPFNVEEVVLSQIKGPTNQVLESSQACVVLYTPLNSKINV